MSKLEVSDMQNSLIIGTKLHVHTRYTLSEILFSILSVIFHKKEDSIHVIRSTCTCIYQTTHTQTHFVKNKTRMNKKTCEMESGTKV